MSTYYTTSGTQTRLPLKPRLSDLFSKTHKCLILLSVTVEQLIVLNGSRVHVPSMRSPD